MDRCCIVLFSTYITIQLTMNAHKLYTYNEYFAVEKESSSDKMQTLYCSRYSNLKKDVKAKDKQINNLQDQRDQLQSQNNFLNKRIHEMEEKNKFNEKK